MSQQAKSKPKPAEMFLDTNQAKAVVLALNTWIYGEAGDEANFDKEYHDEEIENLLISFQTTIGAQPTGQWNPETFEKANLFVNTHFESETGISELQFQQVIQDLQNYYEHKIDKEALDLNFDGYLVEDRQFPIHTPALADTVGFASFQKQTSPDDLMYLSLALADFELSEIEELAGLVRGDRELKQTIETLESYFSANEVKTIKPNSSLFQHQLTRIVLLEIQAELIEMPEAKCSGEWDQATYDAFQGYLKSEYDLDMSAEHLRNFTNHILKQYAEAGRGNTTIEKIEDLLQAKAD